MVNDYYIIYALIFFIIDNFIVFKLARLLFNTLLPIKTIVVVVVVVIISIIIIIVQVRNRMITK